jgi:NMD protein affecting ribosome stability and mRNA decay
MKVCSDCGEMKPAEDYQRRAKSKDGLQTRCRACASRRVLLSRHPDRVNSAFCPTCEAYKPLSSAHWLETRFGHHLLKCRACIDLTLPKSLRSKAVAS